MRPLVVILLLILSLALKIDPRIFPGLGILYFALVSFLSLYVFDSKQHDIIRMITEKLKERTAGGHWEVVAQKGTRMNAMAIWGCQFTFIGKLNGEEKAKAIVGHWLVGLTISHEDVRLVVY